MEKVYKSKVAKWYLWTCISMTLAFVGSIYLSYKSTWVLLINVVFMGFCLWLMFDILLHTDYTIKGGYIAYPMRFFVPYGFAGVQNLRNNT